MSATHDYSANVSVASDETSTEVSPSTPAECVKKKKQNQSWTAINSMQAQASSQTWTQQRAPTTPVIAETEPEEIEELWEMVRLHNKPTPPKFDPWQARRRSWKFLIPDRFVTDVRAGDTQFRGTVLRSRGIRFMEDASYMHFGSAHDHFGTLAPAGPVWEHYRGFHPHSSVWLQVDSERAKYISQRYYTFEKLGRSQTQFSLLARAYLLKDDGRAHSLRSAVSEVVHLAPSGSLHNNRDELPIIDSDFSTQSFKFNLTSTLTYQLSISLFKEGDRKLAGLVTEVGRYGGTAPYLTVEFKKHYQSNDLEAENKMAAATSLWLNLRCSLRTMRLLGHDMHGTHISASDYDDIKHYAVTFRSSRYTIWIITPILTAKGRWNGASVRRLYDGHVFTEQGVSRCVEWMNEIHHWGLGNWLKMFKFDIEEILKDIVIDEAELRILAEVGEPEGEGEPEEGKWEDAREAGEEGGVTLG